MQQPTIIKNTALGIEIHVKYPITQGDMEKFGAAMLKYPGEAQSLKRGAAVRSALEAGWLPDAPFTSEQVPDQDPSVIVVIAKAIDTIYEEITTIPPE